MKNTPPLAPPRTPALAAVAIAAALAAACGGVPEYEPAPLDRFTFPSSLAVVPGGDLLVLSSNFELTFAEEDGGSVIRVDATPTPAVFRSGVRMPSFGGQIALADATACGFPRTAALVTARTATDLYRFQLEDDGTLSCGADCRIPLGEATEIATDPYGVAAVCAPGRPPRAYVSFLSTPNSSGYMTEIDLATGAAVVRELPLGPARSFAYDAERSRLFFTGRGLVPQAPLRWFELGGGCSLDPSQSGACPLAARDLSAFVRGADLQGIALSNPQDGLVRRAYVAARVYDADLAVQIGGRPGFDVGGVLLVLDLAEQRGGDVGVSLVRAVSVGRGAAEVAVLPARSPVNGTPRRDVVVLTTSEEGLLWVYDDELGAVATVLEADVVGHPLAGREPFALAVADAGGGEALVYVSSFDEAFVTPFRVPLEDPGSADADPPGPETRRIGAETP